MITSTFDARIENLRAALDADPSNEGAAEALWRLLHLAGREDEAREVIVPTRVGNAMAATDVILASNGARPRRVRFTLLNEENGKRITFCSRRERWDGPSGGGYNADDHDGDDRQWIIGAMVGSDNDASYASIGVLRRERVGSVRFYYSNRSSVPADDVTVQAFA